IAYSGNGTTTPVIPTTASPRVGSGINYQYGINLREFWRASLVAFSGTPQSYSNKEYGGDFQTLSSTNQLQALKDLWSNAPKTKYATSDDLTGFSNILPSDFAYELTFMTWAGFLMDPLYGGNQNMVGWDYVGYNGVNFGNFYGEGFRQKDIMMAQTPTKIKTATIRNDSSQFALPVRRYTMPIQYHALGHGVGGAAQHYGGTMGRQGPWGYQMLSRTNQDLGVTALTTPLPSSINPQGDTHDWPLTYAQYEPYYVAWENAHGLCGNYNGSPTNSSTDQYSQDYPWMSQNYRLPPHRLTPVAQLFQTAAKALNYNPFPHVSALASQPYTNQYGVVVNPCVYDGYC